jgi:hypothetical protein
MYLKTGWMPEGGYIPDEIHTASTISVKPWLLYSQRDQANQTYCLSNEKSFDKYGRTTTF